MFQNRGLMHRGGGLPRPPLPGQLIGLAFGILVLAGAVYVALRVVVVVLSLLAPLLVLLMVYRLFFGRLRR
jgi:hypothetical protein